MCYQVALSGVRETIISSQSWKISWRSSCLVVPKSGCMRVGLQRKLSTEEMMLLNCGVGEDS